MARRVWKRSIPGNGVESRCGPHELSAELKVPGSLHFGDGNSGLPIAPLKRPPANPFWANISPDVPEGVAYPPGKIKPAG